MAQKPSLNTQNGLYDFTFNNIYLKATIFLHVKNSYPTLFLILNIIQVITWIILTCIATHAGCYSSPIRSLYLHNA